MEWGPGTGVVLVEGRSSVEWVVTRDRSGDRRVGGEEQTERSEGETRGGASWR